MCISAYDLGWVQSETVRKLKKAFVPKMMTAEQASTFWDLSACALMYA